MALLRSFEPKDPHRRPSLHEEIGAQYMVFENDGRIIVQIDTYGRRNRMRPNQKSQTIQLDKVGASALFRILKKAFHF
jgi:hypothetical protein